MLIHKSYFRFLGLSTLLLLTLGLQAQNDLKSAILLTKSEQFEAAKEAFDKLVATEPANGENYFYYGENYLASFFADTIAVSLKDVAGPAKAMYKKGTEVDPEDPLCYVGLAKIALLSGDTSATTYFKLAISKFPSKTNKNSKLTPEKMALTDAKIAETMIQAKVQNVSKPLELMEKAGALDSKNKEIFLIWGDVYLQNNDGSNAIIKYKAAQDLDPQSPSAKLRLGKLWGRARNYNEAIKYYQEAIQVDSSFSPAYVELGAIYMMAGKKELAKQYFEKYLKHASTIRAKVKYLSVLIDLKDYATAIPIALEIKKADPSRNDMNRALAYCYFETKDYPKAKESIDAFFKNTTPEKTIISDWVYRGKIESKVKNDSVAVIYFKNALALDTTNYELYSDIASSYSNYKKFDDARKWYEKKITKKVANYFDYYKLGNVNMQLELWGKADTAFSNITDKKPDYLQGRAFLMRARTNDKIDLDGSKGLAKPFYENYITYGKADTVKYAKELFESYNYLRYFYIRATDYCNAKLCTERILALISNEKILAIIDPEGKNVDVPTFKDLLASYAQKCHNK